MQKLPLVTVTCARDLALLELQAQSIYKHLTPGHDVYIVVNEADPSEWQSIFDEKIKHYYTHQYLHTYYRHEFDAPWASWRPGMTNQWSSGWETQQILKLAIAKQIANPGYFVLDTQNFLIHPWSCSIENEKLPYRSGKFVMPIETWDAYATALDTDIGYPTDDTLSICTPIFLNTHLVLSLIEYFKGLAEFSKWFKSTRNKSEFILYLLWAEKNGGLDKFHYKVNDWGNPMLRDGPNFDADFEYFVGFIGQHKPHVWVSANHRSWGDMNDFQYHAVCSKLKEYGLEPNFAEYRKDYLTKYR